MTADGALPMFRDSGPPIPRGKLGVLLLIVSEMMFFVGLLGAFFVARFSQSMWPVGYLREDGAIVVPPRAEIAPVLGNAAVLTLSFIVALMAERAARRGELRRARTLLGTTLVLGVLFLGVMVFEFSHEWARGLTIRAGQYGAMFFCITSAHGLHVLGGVLWGLTVIGRRMLLPAGGVNWQRVEHFGLYWGFVTVLWYVLVGMLHFL